MESKIKIAFVSLGCDKNLMDSEIMLGLINEEGYIVTPEEENADIIIVNSCGFKMDASEEGIENILRVADYKNTGKCKGLILAGCMAQRYREEIFESLPEVDGIVGTGDFEGIVKVIKDILAGEKQVKLITDNNKKLDESNSLKRVVTTTGGFAYLKIAEGCDKRCTYCTIPSIRGNFRSRTMESLIEEAKLLASQDVKEIILVAQDSSLYGTDLYNGKKMLPELLRKLSEIDGIEWIRILYCYPEHIDNELIDEMANNPKVCNYIDMPIQHADDKILKLMGRRSTREKLETVIEKLREKMPDICIRTTFIVGFPNETEEEFNNLLDFTQKMKFDRLGVFTYSREEGTPAYNMDNQVDEDVKIKRQQVIMEAQKDISSEKCRKFIGETLKVIVEGKIEGEENVYCGRSFRDCYEIDGFVFFDGLEAVSNKHIPMPTTSRVNITEVA
ncbi:MAG: 30S ribosomal protein S12 methylthiotransferase RimO, partial [Eubacteriales bacterium]|nr:30S ribosomal protein S12 methylthiotransferase RimO [Eubacteriales bacterium]